MESMIAHQLSDLISMLGICVFMPCFIAWSISRIKINNDNRRTELLLEAIKSSGSQIDPETLAKAFTKPTLSPSEILTRRLLCGLIFTLLGVAATLFGIYVMCTIPEFHIQYMMFMIAGVAFSIGISFLVIYFIAKNQIQNKG